MHGINIFIIFTAILSAVASAVYKMCHLAIFISTCNCTSSRSCGVVVNLSLSVTMPIAHHPVVLLRVQDFQNSTFPVVQNLFPLSVSVHLLTSTHISPVTWLSTSSRLSQRHCGTACPHLQLRQTRLLYRFLTFRHALILIRDVRFVVLFATSDTHGTARYGVAVVSHFYTYTAFYVLVVSK